MGMNKKQIVAELVERVKEFEKEVSENYIGKLSAAELKAYQKDVVGRIKSELDELYGELEEN